VREWLAILNTSKGLKVVLGIKLVALVLIWVGMDGGFRFGDRAATAAEEKEAKAEAAAEAKPEEGGKDVKVASAAVEGEEKKPTETKARKSFLANLLELPELDPGTQKKEELGKYLEIAERKQRQIEERLQLLRNREEQLKGLESSIDEKLRVLDDERRYFAQTIQQEKDLKGERLEKLISMYAKMEPKKAAPVLEKLDKDLVVELFKQLPQKQITAILEVMSPEKSVEISEYYGRVRSTREYDMLKEMNSSIRKEFDDCKGMPKVAE
jgi:flagellar motility protein MotE (MotC chaperone)